MNEKVVRQAVTKPKMLKVNLKMYAKSPNEGWPFLTHLFVLSCVLFVGLTAIFRIARTKAKENVLNKFQIITYAQVVGSI